MMKSPPHPGRIVRQECLEPLGITITQAARALEVERQTLNNLVNQLSGVRPKWPSGYPRPSAALRKCGSVFRCSTTSARAESDASAMKVKKISHNQPQKTA
jgi:antitoxin HigA-1